MKEQSERKLLGVAGFAWLFDAMDVGMLSFIIDALAAEWKLNEAQMGWIGSVSSIGMAVGALIFGIMADRFGRKNILIVTLLIFSVCAGLSALTTGLGIFLLLRFFVGMGLGGELPVASTLVSESVALEKRGRTVVLLESFWAVGWIIAAIISYFIIPPFGWRIALVIGALPALYAFYLRWNVRDSSSYAAQTREKTGGFIKNCATVWSGHYVRRTTMLWILWFTVVFSYYGMFLWLPSVVALKGFDMIHSFQYVLIMTLAQLPGYFSAAWLIEKWGRKAVLIVYLLGTAVSAYFFGQSTSLALLLTSGILLSFFNLGAWGALYAYSPEQYPTRIRATGTGMAAGFGRIGGIFGPLLVGYLLTRQIAMATIFTIFCVAIIIGVLAVFFLGKETRQQKIEEAA
ncbi:MAG: MFS transporter [Sporolactobacillus sp.]